MMEQKQVPADELLNVIIRALTNITNDIYKIKDVLVNAAKEINRLSEENNMLKNNKNLEVNNGNNCIGKDK